MPDYGIVPKFFLDGEVYEYGDSHGLHCQTCRNKRTHIHIRVGEGVLEKTFCICSKCIQIGLNSGHKTTAEFVESRKQLSASCLNSFSSGEEKERQRQMANADASLCGNCQKKRPVVFHPEYDENKKIICLPKDSGIYVCPACDPPLFFRCFVGESLDRVIKMPPMYRDAVMDSLCAWGDEDKTLFRAVVADARRLFPTRAKLRAFSPSRSCEVFAQHPV